MSDEERLRRAFRNLFYFQGKTRTEIEEIKEKLKELEERLDSLFQIGNN